MIKIAKPIVLTLLVVSVLSCSKKPLQVNPIDSNSALNTKGIIYSLPRTLFQVKVESVKQVIVPGPFAKYAQKYMGIADVPLSKVEEWKITNVSIVGKVEPDPSALFAATPGDNYSVDFLKLCNAGLIIPVSGLSIGSYMNNADIKMGEGSKSIFTDLSVTPFIATEKTSFISRVQKDSIFIKVPVQKEIVVEKSMEEKARDAADFIFSLRKRRSDFLSVDADHNLNGEGLKIAFDEINRLENEYLSLFIGKSFTENAVHTFEYLPTQPDGESSILFRFSSTKGVLPSSDLSGNPVLIRFESEKFPDSYKNLFDALNTEKGKPLTAVIYYRIPLMANIRITDSKIDFLNYRSTIYQYGQVVRMPVKYVIKDSGFIDIKDQK